MWVAWNLNLPDLIKQLKFVYVRQVACISFGCKSTHRENLSINSCRVLSLHWAFARVRVDMPCSNLTNPRKLNFPSVCLIQSLRTAWTGMEGPRPSSWNSCQVTSMELHKAFQSKRRRLIILLSWWALNPFKINNLTKKIPTYWSKFFNDNRLVTILVEKFVCTTGTLFPAIKCLQLMHTWCSCTKLFKIHSSVLKCIQLSWHTNSKVGTYISCEHITHKRSLSIYTNN